MRKISILIVISFTSLIIMACGFSGWAQQNMKEQSHQTVNATKTSTATEGSSVEENETSSQIMNTPIPTTDPVQEAKSCLAKTWEIQGLSDYVVAAVPPELANEYDLQYKDTNGQATFTLTPAGKIIMNADNLEFLFTAKASIFEVPVTVRIDGSAIGNYDVDGTTLTTSNMDTRKLTASAQALNEDLIEPAQIIKSIPFINPPYNTAKYTCQGDTLKLTLSGYPESIPPLVFQTVD